MLTTSLAQAASAQTAVRVREMPANFFPASTITATVQIASAAALQGRLAWEVSADGAVIGRGETELTLAAPGELAVHVTIAMPEARPDAAIAGRLRVSLSSADLIEPVHAEKPFWILGAAPWLGRTQWLEDLRILIFDPDQTTTPALQQAGIPFTLMRNPEALLGAARRHGVLVIAEHLDFREYRGLAKTIFAAAAAGIPVICLAPAGGTFELPGMGASKLPRPRSIRLADRSIIHELDKRLDADCWGVDGRSILSSICVHPENSGMIARVATNSTGWPWLEYLYPPANTKNTKLILTGFAIMKKWDETPAARHLFMRLLEYTAAQEWRKRIT